MALLSLSLVLSFGSSPTLRRLILFVSILQWTWSDSYLPRHRLHAAKLARTSGADEEGRKKEKNEMMYATIHELQCNTANAHETHKIYSGKEAIESKAWQSIAKTTNHVSLWDDHTRLRPDQTRPHYYYFYCNTTTLTVDSVGVVRNSMHNQMCAQTLTDLNRVADKRRRAIHRHTQTMNRDDMANSIFSHFSFRSLNEKLKVLNHEQIRWF